MILFHTWTFIKIIYVHSFNFMLRHLSKMLYGFRYTKYFKHQYKYVVEISKLITKQESCDYKYILKGKIVVQDQEMIIDIFQDSEGLYI